MSIRNINKGEIGVYYLCFDVRIVRVKFLAHHAMFVTLFTIGGHSESLVSVSVGQMLSYLVSDISDSSSSGRSTDLGDLR